MSEPSTQPRYRPSPLPLHKTFLETILPFVLELTYLDIYLRCYEWRDEIRLDRVLRSCPKLQYMSVDRNMCGRVAFDDPVSLESDQDQAGWMYDDDDDDDDGEEDGEKGMDYVDEIMVSNSVGSMICMQEHRGIYSTLKSTQYMLL
ncbi:hypothetical protein BG011_001498 [Mortierella polycephala]|uniref:Uncharacterized protein n=1 Tax=Mortierella polycephala TaxID=41804 RepID=A0A9P6QE69_9FUNG|nr:hypothetical protein BG011_001498 [Mortierella polycephala]